MASGFGQVEGWVEDHPYATAAIVVGGGLAILWLFGFFGSSNSASTGTTNLAGAYYAAEQSQTQAGAAIQISTLQTTAATAQDQIQANAATAINASNNTASVLINQQNAGSANTIAGYQLAGVQAGYDAQTAQTQAQYGYLTAVSSNQLQATYSNNNTAYATAINNNATAYAINGANNAATYANNQLAANTQVSLEGSQISGVISAIQTGGGTVPVSGAGISYAPYVTGPGQAVISGGSVIGQPTGPVSAVGPYGYTSGPGGWYNQQGQLVIPQ